MIADLLEQLEENEQDRVLQGRLASWLEATQDVGAIIDAAKQHPTSLGIIETCARNVLERAPNNVAALELLAQVYTIYSDVRDPGPIVDRLLLLDANNLRGLDMKIQSLDPTEMTSKIQTLASRMLEADPDDSRAVSYLAKALHIGGKKQEAIALVEAFLARIRISAPPETEGVLRHLLEQLKSTANLLSAGLSWP